MKICRKCNSEFSNTIYIDNIKVGLYNRKFCLKCSPFKKHNTRCLDEQLISREVGEYLCFSCGEKDITNFYNDKRSVCKKCYVGDITSKRRDNKQFALEYLGGRCKLCGFDSFHEALSFHHLDPTIKDDNFKSKWGWSKKRLLVELDKCVLLCMNCHMGVHADKLRID